MEMMAAGTVVKSATTRLSATWAGASLIGRELILDNTMCVHLEKTAQSGVGVPTVPRRQGSRTRTTTYISQEGLIIRPES
jgi:hypothetical protein